MAAAKTLPPLAPFPPSSLRSQLAKPDWESLLETWNTICQAYLSYSSSDFFKDESLAAFLSSFITEISEDGPSSALGSSPAAKPLYNSAASLFCRTLESRPPAELIQWEVLADASKLFTKARVAPAYATLFSQYSTLETSFSQLKKSLITKLDAGFKTDMGALEQTLARLNHLLHASPDAAAFFLAGSDFLDGLITCYKIMNPPLRKVIIATTYICLLALIEDDAALQTSNSGKGKRRFPQWGMMSDTLYSLLSAAEAHRAGPTSGNDSLVAELISATPLLAIVLRRGEESGALTSTLKARIDLLQGFKKMGVGATRPRNKRKRTGTTRTGKGKGLEDDNAANAEMHMHKMSQIALIQDLFPDLGSGFVARMLDEYGDNIEVVTAHLLEDSLPPHLANADRTEQLSSSQASNTAISQHHDLAPRSTPPPPEDVPSRRNMYDDDELTESMSNLHFGKRPGQDADALLTDRSQAPKKAAIMSALAAFDSDDDERDDTYDVDDVGGAIDTAAGGEEQAEGGANEEVLFMAWLKDPKTFNRDAATRRENRARGMLREDTGMTDEAIEGWAVMLQRSPKLKRRLEAKFTAFTGEQNEVASTAWRAGAEGSETEGGASSSSRGGRGRGRGRGRGGRGGPGGGRGGGNVAGPTGEKDTEVARKRKEASKGSRANHNRRDQRARKMGRGGLPG